MIGDRWEIDEDIYMEFLEMLPPMGWRGGAFYMSEFSFGDITTKFTREGGKYYRVRSLPGEGAGAERHGERD